GLLQSALLSTHPPVAVLQTWPLAHCVSLVHLPHWLGVFAPQIEPFVLAAQSAFVQQLPWMQALPPPVAAQHTSLGFAHAVPTVVPEPLTHVPPPAGLQIEPGPYVGSAWHCASVVQPPHWLVAPQSCPAVAQSPSLAQLPGMHDPPTHA